MYSKAKNCRKITVAVEKPTCLSFHVQNWSCYFFVDSEARDVLQSKYTNHDICKNNNNIQA